MIIINNKTQYQILVTMQRKENIHRLSCQCKMVQSHWKREFSLLQSYVCSSHMTQQCSSLMTQQCHSLGICHTCDKLEREFRNYANLQSQCQKIQNCNMSFTQTFLFQDCELGLDKYSPIKLQSQPLLNQQACRDKKQINCCQGGALVVRQL